MSTRNQSVTEPPESWHTIGWGGISFNLPIDWQPTLIYDSYLFFEQQGQPAFEIKWQQIQGRFAPDRILNKLYKSLKPAGTFIKPWDLPEQLKRLLPGHSLTGFQWQGSNRDCRGILMFCPGCRRATLLQIYGKEQTDNRILADILASFTDHTDGDEQLWSMYEIKAVLPVQASLTNHEFLLGRFNLAFKLQGTTLNLFRFKPAGTILADRSLNEVGEPLTESAPLIRSSIETATWSQTLFGIEKILALAKRKPQWTWLHLWHIPDKNVILGVKGAGKRPLEDTVLHRIVENFTVI